MQDFFDPSRKFLMKRLGAKVQGEVDGAGGMRDEADGDEVLRSPVSANRQVSPTGYMYVWCFFPIRN